MCPEAGEPANPLNITKVTFCYINMEQFITSANVIITPYGLTVYRVWTDSL